MTNMTNSPLVSIIVRTKDRPKLLVNALQSIAAQNYRPVEVVLVNDGGCDVDVRNLQGILGEVPLIYHRLTMNTGRTHAGNTGIENARGEYVGFLDDDDQFYEDHVETLISFLKQSEYRIAYTDARLIHKLYDIRQEAFVEIDKGVFHSFDFSFDKLLVENFIPFMCIIFPRELLQSVGGFDESLDLYEDWDLLIRTSYNNPFYHINKVTAKYNIWSEHLQITERAKYSGETGIAYSRIFHKHLNKFTHETIQSALRERERVRDALLSKLREREKEKEAALSELREREREKEAALSDLREREREKEAALSELREREREKSVIVSEARERDEKKEAIISETTAEIERLRRAIEEKNISLSVMYNLEKEKVVAEKEATISELRERTKDKDRVIAEKEAAMSELKGMAERVVNEKETAISELREKAGDRERLILEKETVISAKETIISEKDRELEKLRGIITERDFIISEIYNSLGWQFLSKYRRLKDILLPLGTRRRKLYDYGRKGIGVIKNEGFRRFSHKARTKFSTEILDNAEKKIRDYLSYDAKPLSFPKLEKPEVSVIIPVFNNCLCTIDCIKSISENTSDVEYEIIVVDNASTDNTRRILNDIPNIRVVTNSRNLGFVEACNGGARNAKGEYLIFLNNDTKVTKGWMKALLDTAKEDSLAGIVGAKLIYPNGKLQEAGGIVWSDGSAWNYGRNDDAEKPEYNHLREVDYCSAACILVRKELFEKVGGFDVRYAPAYCEDSDLAFSLRKLGYKTLYQPRAEIIHLEGMTAGTDTSKGMKHYQETNRGKFAEKWKKVLINEHLPSGKEVFLARERNCKKKKRMLFIDHYVPTYDKDAGSVRMFEYLKIFVDMGFKIVFWPDNLAKMEPYTGELQQMGVEVIYGYNNFNKYIDDFGKYFDVAYLSRAHIAIKYINKIKKSTAAKIIYDSHDLAFLREERRAAVETNVKLKEEILKIKQREFNLAKMSDAMIVVSPYEKELMLQEDPSLTVYHLPHIHPVGPVSKNGFSGRRDIMFIGGFVHPPNEDAVCWFANDVLPRVIGEIPDVKFYVIGSYPTKKVKSLASENIVVTGYVPDVSPYFYSTRVCVAPLRYGAGVKGKIIHSMTYGLPVVTTTVGAEGLGLENGKNVLVADGPEEFAERVINVYKNRDTWNRISKSSHAWVQANFTPDVAKKKLLKMFQDLGVLNNAPIDPSCLNKKSSL